MATIEAENPSKLITTKSEVEKEKVYKWDIVWTNVIILGVLHLAALYGLYLSTNMKFATILWSKCVLLLSTFGLAGGSHRLWSHKAFKANFKYQAMVLMLNSITYQNSIYVWCRDHRMHHTYTDTDADPHNSKRGFFFSHVGWLLVRKHKMLIEKGPTIDVSDLKANKLVMLQHKYYYYFVLLFGVAIPMFIPVYFWGEKIMYTFFYCVAYRYILGVNSVWCINSLAHMSGNKPFDKNMSPTESWLTSIVCFGEGFHNYHHTFPWDYKVSEFGGDVRNATTAFIDLFAWIGWVTDRKYASKQMVESRCQRTGDGTHTTNNWLIGMFNKVFHKDFVEQMKRFILVGLYVYIM